MKHHNSDKGFIPEDCPQELKDLYKERHRLKGNIGFIMAKTVEICPMQNPEGYLAAQLEFNEWALAINALADKLRDAEACYGIAY